MSLSDINSFRRSERKKAGAGELAPASRFDPEVEPGDRGSEGVQSVAKTDAGMRKKPRPLAKVR